MPQKKKTTIVSVVAREILDSRGVPTIEAEVALADGSKAWSQVPSGASTGAFEALELRDDDPERYFGKGVQKAVAHVNGPLAQKVIGMDALAQKALDRAMIKLDGTPNKASLGANAILAVSLAACRAAAMSQGLPLYQHIAALHKNKGALTTPIPMFNIINGGKHADSGLAIQEYKIVPHGLTTFADQYRAGSEIFHALKTLLHDAGHTTAVGDEGGFAPRLESNTAPLTEIATAVENAGYTMGEQVGIAIDAAANSFYNDTCGHYVFELEKKGLSAEKLVETYEGWINEHFIMSVEDGLREEDWDGWQMMNKRLGDKVMLIGDDLIVTNVTRLKQAIAKNACNAVLIKPNQIGTLSETLECIALAQKNDMKTIVSHRSGETIDDFIADMAVGAGTDFIKSGSLSRGERLCKYNRLLTIEEQLQNAD